MTPVPKLSPILDDATIAAIAAAVDRQRGGGPAWLRSDLAKLGLSWLVAALLAYGVVNARVAVLEDRVDDMKDNITEIRQDIKTLLRRTP